MDCQSDQDPSWLKQNKQKAYNRLLSPNSDFSEMMFRFGSSNILSSPVIFMVPICSYLSPDFMFSELKSSSTKSPCTMTDSVAM